MSWAKSEYDENPFTEESNTVPTNPTYTPIADTRPIETPQWMKEGGAKPQQKGDVETGNAQTEANPDVPRMILYTRVTNLVLSVCMIIVSLLSLLTTQSATTGVLSCYVVVFSCLFCCFETHLKQVSKIIALNFGFMYSAKSRSLFMIFVGTILFSMSLFGKIIGILMLANAGFNLYIVFRYPEYEDIQRNDAQSEIKDFLASNPAFAKKVLTAGVAASADVLARNPEIARQGAEALFKASAQKPTNDAKGAYTSV